MNDDQKRGAKTLGFWMFIVVVSVAVGYLCNWYANVKFSQWLNEHPMCKGALGVFCTFVVLFLFVCVVVFFSARCEYTEAKNQLLELMAGPCMNSTPVAAKADVGPM